MVTATSVVLVRLAGEEIFLLVFGVMSVLCRTNEKRLIS
jgi:hypothetical protein